MQEALFYKKLENDSVQCELCPWNCALSKGFTGYCKVRENVDGRLETAVYNKVAAMGVDPIEKKPLYHFYPGKNILSIGEVGCNLRCRFCQNHHISQSFARDFKNFHPVTSKQLVGKALHTYQNIGIAYTYNEPFIFYEFMLDTARLAHQNGLLNVVVSNGYVNSQPLQNILPEIDAFNIDLKAFNNQFYRKYTNGKLAPVLQSLRIIAESPAHLEITNLVIPGLNDNENEFEEMVKWIATELGRQIPFHISRYFPQHEFHLPPTPIPILEKLYEIAKKHLQHVYTGNVNDSVRSSTYCPECGEVLVSRNRFKTRLVNINAKGQCSKCGADANIVR